MATTVPRRGREVPEHIPDAPLSPATDDDLFDDLDPLLEIPGARRSSAGSCSAGVASSGVASSTGEWSMFSFDGNAEDDECSWNNNNFDEKQGDGDDAEVVVMSGSVEVEVDHAVAAADPAAEGTGVNRRVFARQRRRMSCPMMGGASSGPPVSIVSMEATQVTPPDELELSERLFDEKLDPFDESLGEIVDTVQTSKDELLASAGASTKRSRTAEPEGTTSAATPFVRAKRRMSCPSIGIGDHHLGSFEPEPIPLPSYQLGQSRLQVDFGHQPSSQVAAGTGAGGVSHSGYHLTTEQSRFILNNLLHPNNNGVGGTDVGQLSQTAAAPDTAGAAHASRESMMRYALSVLSKRNMVGRPEEGDAFVTQQSRSDVDGKGNATAQQPKRMGEAPRVKGRNRKKDIFPQKLMKLLDDEKHHDVVRWLPDGEAFVVLKRQEFVRTALPGFFAKKEATKYESFTRKLNRWGFDRLIAKEREKSERVYCHEYFKRDDPNLCLQMRTKDELDRLSTREQLDTGLDPISPSLVPTNIQASREGVNCADRLNDGIPPSIKPFVGADFASSPNGGAIMNGMPGMMDALHLQHQVQLKGSPSCYVPPVSGNASPHASNISPLSSQTGVDQLNHNANGCMMYVSGGTNEPSPPVSSATNGNRLEGKPLT